MKRILLSVVMLSFFIAQNAFAAVGIKVDGVSAGDATTLNLKTHGGTVLNDGSDWTVPTIGANMIAAGVANGGATSMTTSTLAVPIGYGYIRKAISSDPAFSAGTMANGTPGQLLTLHITERQGSGTFVLTPTTKTGFASITFDAVGEIATFWYVDDTTGWVLFGNTNATITLP